MTKHQTETLNIRGEDIEIDCLMVPLIKWLNSLPTVKTQHCCEGEEDKVHKPYVILTCDNDDDLRIILQTIQPQATQVVRELFPQLQLTAADHYSFGVCEVDFKGMFKRYIIRFADKWNFIKFNEFMDKINDS